MEFNSWIIYLTVISALIFLPGPSALLCISHGLKYGHVKTIATVLGGAVASLILMTISIVGLGAVLAASTDLFFIVKIVGASYLIYLGISAWNDSSYQIEDNGQTTSILTPSSFISLFYKGFMVGISNPKDLLFFAALLPGFINVELPQFEQYLTLAATWLVIDFIAMFMYASLGTKVSPWFSKPKNLKSFQRTTGGIFILTGSALAISSKLNREV